MASLDEVVCAMQANGLPPLPPGHPICDGKERRYGRRKKAWYKLNQIDTTSGKTVVYGVFGYWSGKDNGAVGVSLESDKVSKEELAAARRRQEEAARLEAEKQEEIARRASNRAKMQWAAARDADPENTNVSPYLKRKQVEQEGVRVTADGLTLIPMIKYGPDGARIMGLQKIAPDGSKQFNKGMAKVGTSCRIGGLSPDSPLVLCGEGYATIGSVRLGTDRQYPAVVAFDAGNLPIVAQEIRRDCPNTHILFVADDDWQLHKRLAKWLVKTFKVAATVVIDGVAHQLVPRDFDEDGDDPVLQKRLEVAASVRVELGTDGREYALVAEDGVPVFVTVQCKTDPNGIAFIEVDVRAGRQVGTRKFENAGIAAATAAAKAVGNASVVWPVFENRGQSKWTDFNDLHVEQSLDAVREQLTFAVDRALSAQSAPDVSPAPFHGDTRPAGEEAAVQSVQSDAPVPDGSPDPLLNGGVQPETGLVSIEWALEHCALIQGSTDVWDSLNKLRMKKSAFLLMVGKETAKQWESHAKRRAISPRNLPKLQRGVALDEGGRGDGIAEMLDRYTLLYGTKTVWDAEKRMVLTFDAMSLARGSDLATRWIEHPLHREIDADKLVFDPTQRLPLETHVNMFQGFPLVPKQDDAKCDMVLELLHNLCSSEENGNEVFEWVIRWLAYPLQHPGAKMQTSLLFFGEKQGTGKSLFFEGIMRPIYGIYGMTAGQHQLESQYTAWKSQKLYVVFEEILSRQDKYSHFGLIKHMITGRDHRLNEKHLPERTEANHLNAVMLSNEFQAVPIEPNDRRFLVAESRNVPPIELIDKIKANLDSGLIEAFYDFLLKYPLSDFHPHTKPPMTGSKQRVIRYGLPGWDAFYQSWAAGDVPNAPYCTCRTEDLYTVYKRWCEANGEKRLSLTKFSEFLSMRVDKSRQWAMLGSKPRKQYMMFVVPSEKGESLSAQCERFRKEAEIQGGL